MAPPSADAAVRPARLSRRLLLAAATLGLATATGCSALPLPGRDPPPSTPPPTGQLTLTQGLVTTFTGPGGASLRVGYVNRFDDRNVLSIWRDADPAGFESLVDVRDADALPIAGGWWCFAGRAQLGARSRMEIITLTSSRATIKRWTGLDMRDDSDERFQPTSAVQRGYVAFSSAGR